LSSEKIDGKAVLEALTSNILNIRFKDLDRETVVNTKYRIWDMIGCAIGGAMLPDIVALVKMVQDWGGKKEATIIGHGVRGPAQDVAFVNCLMGRSFERGPLTFRDGNRSWSTHTSETTILSALALGESLGINGQEFITALIAGEDLANRVFGAAGGGIPGQGPGQAPSAKTFSSWGTVPTLGTAAIAGRLMRLNSFQLKNALGIAINLMSGGGSGILDRATIFKLSQGSSGRNGILAAYLAKAGWTGLEDPFGPDNGYYPYFARGSCTYPELLTKDLGKKFYVEVVFKLVPGGGPTQSTTACALQLARKHDINVDEIREVILRTSPPQTAVHYSKPYKVGNYPTADALFSYKYSVANALVRKTAQNRDYTEEAVRDSRVQAVISKITLTNLNKSDGVEVEVEMKDGHRISEYYVDTSTINIDAIPSREALLEKYREQVEFTQLVNKQDADEIIRLVDKLEEVENVAQIASLAVKR
jgi:2-methylcitrate dehydratase PrpD